MRYNHLDMLPEKAFKPVGKRMTLEGGGGGSQTSTGTTYTSNVPEYAKPYYQELLKQTGKETFKTDDEGVVTGIKDYTPYTGERVAGFNPQQTSLQRQYANLQAPTGFASAQSGTNFGQNLGYGAAGAGIAGALNYNPSNFSTQQVQAPSLQNYQMGIAQDVIAPSLQNYSMGTAQSGYNPNLQNYQMTGPQDVQSQIFGQGAADYYSNPYQQNVTNAALREAQQKGQLDKNALMSGAIGRGTFGGARNALLQAEQTRGLNQQLGDIQYKGSADAYANAQQQFQADQARRMQADLANQQSGLATGQQNLQANLATQQLGAGIGKDVSLANLSSAQQANVQNLAAQLQTQGLSADAAMKAALANQQAGLTTGQQNLQANLQTQQLGAGQDMAAQQANQAAWLQAQQMAEQSKQFGAGMGKDVGLAGLQAGLDASKTQGALAAAEQTANLERLKAQSTSAAEQQAYQQKIDDLKYQQAMEAQDWQKKQLEFYSNILHGTSGALGSTQVNYTPQASPLSQLAGAGVAGLSAYNLMK